MRKSNKLIESRALDLFEQPETELAPPRAFDVEAGEDDAAHLRKFLSSVRRYLWLVAGVTAVCTALAAVYMARQPDMYEARAQVQVDLETLNTSVGASKNGSFFVNPVNDPAYFNTQLQILTGPRLLRRVVKSLQLESDASFRPSSLSESPSVWQRFSRSAGMSTQAAVGGASDGAPAAGEDSAEAARLAPYVEAIQANLKAEPVKETRLPIKETRLINITYSHTDPRTAARVVNAVVDAFVLSNLERKTEANNTTGGLLQQRVEELQAQIRAQEGQLLDYAKNHEILSLDPGQNTVVERLAGLNRQLLEAENERKVAEAAYRAALEPGAADALAEGAVKETAEAQRKLGDLLQRRAQLLVENTEEWPEVKEVDKQIGELEKQVAQTRERAGTVVLTNLGTRYRQAAAREQALRASFNQQRTETVAQNEAAINYRIIQQEIATNKNLLDGLLQRSKENEAVLAGMRNNIHVNDHAVAPRVPTGPRRLLNTGVALALSLGLGLGLAVLLGHVDRSVRSVDDVERTLPLPALAVIPAVGGRHLLPARHASHRRHRRRGSPRVGARGGNGNGHAGLLLDANAPAPLTEAYRQLRTAMMFSSERGALKSLLLTSGEPGEGKTTMAVNTAVSLVKTGALVLLIDADLRKPRLHSIFGLSNERGLSTILSEETEDVEALGMVVHHKPSRLDVLTSGPSMPDSAELLGSEQMRRLLGVFRSTYDYVVIDSPPVVYFTDGVLLSSLVDGVVLVVNSGESTRDAVRHSYRLLQAAGANVCGVVLNNAEEFARDYKHYYKA